MKTKAIGVLVSALGLILGSAVIAQAADCTGYDILVTQTAESTELDAGHTILLLKAHSVIVSNDPNNIYNLTAGSCFGTIETMPDGTVKQSGHCSRKDADGDTYSLWWAQEAGAERGTWGSLSGTGKFDGLKDSGWFENTMAEGAMFASAYDGACGSK